MRNRILIALLFMTLVSYGQDEKGELVGQTFDDTRIVNGHSVETNEKGQMKLIIGHRFGQIDGGIDELYGLDQATMRLGFDYGVLDWLTVGVGRSSFEKTVDGFVKGRLLNQRNGNGSPITLTWLSTASVKTLEHTDPSREDFKRTRWDYVNQVLIARKFSERLSLQFMPTHLHKNLVETSKESNDIISLGFAGKYKLTKTLSFKTEYYYTLPDQLPDNRENSLSLGFDIETKHHVFQLHFSTSRGMTEKFFIGETFNDISPGKFMFGFNITRNFQLTGKKYK